MSQRKKKTSKKKAAPKKRAKKRGRPKIYNCSVRDATFHGPKKLIAQLDKRAGTEGVSRSQLIVKFLRQGLGSAAS